MHNCLVFKKVSFPTVPSSSNAVQTVVRVDLGHDIRSRRNQVLDFVVLSFQIHKPTLSPSLLATVLTFYQTFLGKQPSPEVDRKPSPMYKIWTSSVLISGTEPQTAGVSGPKFALARDQILLLF